MTTTDPQELLIKRVGLTCLLIYIFLVGKAIPLPGIDHKAIENLFSNGNQYTALNSLSGGSISKLGLFTLNIFPLLNSSIILQFLIPVFPSLESLQKEEGELGQKKLNRIRKFITTLIAFVQAISLVESFSIFIENKFIIVVFLVTGALIVSWISDLITEKGIATGPSLLLFINIASNPKLFFDVKKNLIGLGLIDQFYNAFVFCIVSFFIIILLGAKTEIPLITLKQLMTNEQIDIPKKPASLPLKLNQGGILPVVLATTATILPLTIFGETPLLITLIPVITNLLIIILNYFYTIFLWDPKKISNDLKKVSTVIPGIRPGIETEKYLTKFVTRYSILGGMLLAIVAFLPTLFKALKHPAFYIFDSINITSLIISLGVFVEIVKNIKSLITSTSFIKNF